MRPDAPAQRREACLLICCLLLLFCTARTGAQSVGELVRLSGKATLKRAKKPPQPAAEFMELKAGDRITVSPNSAATLALYERGQLSTLPAGCVAEVSASKVRVLSGPPLQPLRTLPQVLLSPSSTAKPSQGIEFTGVRVRGGIDPTIGPRDPWPIGGVRAATVTLKWAGVVLGDIGANGQPEEVHLSLRIKNAAGGKMVGEWDNLAKTTHSFTVPAGRLRPGVAYLWSVTAVGSQGSGAECGAWFRILTPQELTRVQQAEQAADAARKADPQDPTPGLLLGQIYERYDLLEDALTAYEQAQHLGEQGQALQAKLSKLRNQIGKET